MKNHELEMVMESPGESTEVVFISTDPAGKIYLGTSGNYLVNPQEAERLIEVCKAYLSHIKDDAVASFNDYLYEKRISHQCTESKRITRKIRNETSIYLIRNNRNGYYKIGRSNNAEFRERTLQAEEPEIEMIHSFNGTVKNEKDLHVHFKEKHVRGEWFRLNDFDVNYVKSFTTQWQDR